MKRSFILGLGAHTALGRGLAANVEALLGAPPPPTMVEPGVGGSADPTPSLLLAGLPLGDAEARLYAAAEAVGREAMDAAGLSPAERAETLFVVGTSSVDIAVSEEAYRRALAQDRSSPPLMANSSMGMMAGRLRRALGLAGPEVTISTACTASANGLLYADKLIRSGRARHVLVMGLEVFNLVTALGFQSLALLSPAGMRPFDAKRSGLVLGEGCAAAVLGAEPKEGGGFHLRGGANLCDIYGISAANPSGETIAGVMRAALADAGAAPTEIAGIKAHGTASLLNDEAEAAGMRLVFGEVPQVCALKPFVGHTFGACGLVELALFCGLAGRGLFPAAPGICAEPSELGIRLHQTPHETRPGTFLLNYFGFGGNNTSLVISNAAP